MPSSTTPETRIGENRRGLVIQAALLNGAATMNETAHSSRFPQVRSNAIWPLPK